MTRTRPPVAPTSADRAEISKNDITGQHQNHHQNQQQPSRKPPTQPQTDQKENQQQQQRQQQKQRQQGEEQGQGQGQHENENTVNEARRGLLKAMWQASFAPRFSSKPIDMEDYLSTNLTSFASKSFGSSSGTKSTQDFRTSLDSSSQLTTSERKYLENLLKSEDLESIRRASAKLADKELFPPTPDNGDQRQNQSPPRQHKLLGRRDSDLQQQLYKLHERTSFAPSQLLRKLSSRVSKRDGLLSGSNHTYSASSIVAGDFDTSGNTMASSSASPSDAVDAVTASASTIAIANTNANNNNTANATINSAKANPGPPKRLVDRNSIIRDPSWDPESDDEEPVANRRNRWNPFVDVDSWIDGDSGAELDEDGNQVIPAPTAGSFKILGTSAMDTSCHPHVLSPPLMEGLQGFMPESLHEHNFLLKFSLVRDGPGLLKMLRHCRASTHTILAIETTDGNVFGCFTTEPWKLGGYYYGTSDSFLWRMRRSRKESSQSVMQQALNESKLDVFPYTCHNNHVQFCMNERLAIGDCEISDMSCGGQHYGNAIRLNATMSSGSTSTSETFGNPCLIDSHLRGKEFKVTNVELWAMTQHDTLDAAEDAELHTLFLTESRRRKASRNLNLMEILVSTPRSKRVQHF